MLQIITGKFFETENIFETLHRGVYFTNYYSVAQRPFETVLGRVLPSTHRTGLGSLTYELLEKMEGVRRAGTMTSTGGDEIIEDFAVVFSFVFDVICTTDPDLCRKLTLAKSNEVSRSSYSARFLPRVFDSRVVGTAEDPVKLDEFLRQLLGLRRSPYQATIRAIRQYVAAMHDVGREPTLAYSLLVTSIEALSQTVDVPAATWGDYEERKRQPIDKILDRVPQKTAEELRAAILESEHLAIARRFREFVKARIRPDFYRTEAAGIEAPVSQQDLDLLLKDAYAIRSSYVHRLQELKGLAVDPFSHSEVLYSDEKPTLAFAGLARIVRHVIFTFVLQSDKLEREIHDWNSDLPNIIRMRVDPSYWLSSPDQFAGPSARSFLDGFLQQVNHVLVTPSASINNLSPILDKIETMNLDGLKKVERRSVLTLYHLFTVLTESDRAEHQGILKRLQGEMVTPTIEGVTICLIERSDFPWTLSDLDEQHALYYRTRWNKGSLHIGRLLESILTLRLAELHRLAGESERAAQLISFAVESAPGNQALLAIEEAHRKDPLFPIAPYSLIPPTAEEIKPMDRPQPSADPTVEANPSPLAEDLNPPKGKHPSAEPPPRSPGWVSSLLRAMARLFTIGSRREANYSREE